MARKTIKHELESVAPSVKEVLDSSSTMVAATPLVFISHDSRDADLAEAFDHLLTDASGGVVQTFRSSDQSGRAGIDYGENWFSKITKTLSTATDVVALLTPNSIGRPWILFEAGFAVGRLDAKVFGIALGLPLSKAVSGPFAQFQNCEANEESLTTVVLKLIQRNPNARPREQAVRKQVSAFLEEIAPLIKQRVGTERETKEEMNASAVAKLFEEVKVMFRDLPSKVQTEIREHGMVRRRRALHPMMIEEVFQMVHMDEVSPGFPWLVLSSMLRDEMPWMAEAALEMHRAIESGNKEQIAKAHANMRSAGRLMRHSKLFHRISRGDEETFFLVRHLPDFLERFVPLAEPEERKRRPAKAESQLSTESSADSKK